MNAHRRIWLVTGLVLVGIGVTLGGGAAKSAAEDTPVSGCSAGKPICVSISSIPDPASRSPVDTNHYMAYSLVVSYDTSSGSTSNLVNMAVTVTWADLGVTTTTSTYVAAASDSDCTETAPRTLTCTGTPKSLGPGESFGYDPLVFRTATTTPDNPDDVEATGTNVSVTASAKETPKPPKGGSNVAFVTKDNPTSYEDFDDEDLSIAGGILSTTLATSNAGDVNQLSKLPVPAGGSQRLVKLKEQTYEGAVSCPTSGTFDTCFGQHVTTVAVGLAPVNLQIVYEGQLPSGATENSIGVFHVRDDATTVFITTKCSSATPPLSEITASNGCRLVNLTRLPGGVARVEISAWDISNGGWGGIS